MTVEVPLGQALNLAMQRAMRQDDRVVVMGEDVGTLGGVLDRKSVV